MKTRLVTLLLLMVGVTTAQAQAAPDYRTVEGIMTELYASVAREPGRPI